MTIPQFFKTCPHCDQRFEKLFAHQEHCSIPCAFWSRVNRTDTCWLWTGSIGQPGYGEFRYNGLLLRAHRVSYELHFGPLQTGEDVLHDCDNKPCVRPTHLYAGSDRDNATDRMIRYTSLKRLSPHAARAVDRRLLMGAPVASIARDFNVSYTGIRARKGRLVQAGHALGNGRLTETENAEVERRLRAGDPVADIARDFHVTYQAIYKRKRLLDFAALAPGRK